NLSFVEDPTRILRAVRFSKRFGFKISKQTLTHIRNTIKLDIFKDVSGARLALELKSILEEDIVIEALVELDELGVLEQLDPTIVLNDEMLSLFTRARETLSWYRLLYTDEKVEVWLVLFLALTDQLKEAAFKRLVKRLSIAGKKISAVVEGRGGGLRALRKISSNPDMKSSELYHLLKPLEIEVILYLLEKSDDEEIRRHFSDYITRMVNIKCSLSGAALKRLGVKEGPGIGKVLGQLLDMRLNGVVSTKAEEIALVKEYLKKKR
ncbi:MAG: CCA tRNA nucleotidyltransferase, partial [Proteobacteria bacterium]|nr:CCA tRNA nucleotidyltransferase [Pseudomonadota bacterium]